MRPLESCRACTTVFPILHTWILILTLAALVPASAAVASDADEEDSSPPSVAEPPKEGRPISFEVKEGTWLNLTLSPDGKTLVFDLLGDIYYLPALGGEATRLTSGPSYDWSPRFSPDGESMMINGFLYEASSMNQI